MSLMISYDGSDYGRHECNGIVIVGGGEVLIRSTDYVIKNPAKKKMVGSMLISSKRFHLLRNDLTVVNKVVDVPSKDTKEYWDSDWDYWKLSQFCLWLLENRRWSRGR